MSRCLHFLTAVIVGCKALDLSLSNLDADDECDASDSAKRESCALQALQTKGRAMASGVAEQKDPDEATEWYDNPSQGDGTEVPAESEMLGAGPEMEIASGNASENASEPLGSGPLRHYAQNCWNPCGHKGGYCPGFCGYGNACCRWHFPGPPECQRAQFWPVIHMHTCVRTYSPQPASTGGAVGPYTGVSGSNIMTLYHMTSPQDAQLIMQSNFRPGSGGWCGGAIYLVNTPSLPRTKFNPQTTKSGAWIELKVNMGTMCQMHRTCNDGRSGRCCVGSTGYSGVDGAQGAGCNSMLWNPGDGNEYIIWHPEQILSKRVCSCTLTECSSC
eukprot:TRINITY_DN105603_c0_g1_i1.p1 TRINITY_DN105603_c0_g1~~TRINITY_DN105603_c0_g1_i1.p1  ORF type:complete len:330 (+),score=19.54 TRINITY_DN105603_c0_g1_i1:99-1088(+)